MESCSENARGKMNNFQKTALFFIFCTVMFIALKLYGIISWGWLWVLSPLWIPMILITVIFALILFVAVFREGK